MSGDKLALGIVGALAAGAALSRRDARGSMDYEVQGCAPIVTSGIQRVLASAPEGALPLNKWIDLLQSRGVVRQQMETRGLIEWLEGQRRAGRRSVTKAELAAWAESDPFKVKVVWKGRPLNNKLSPEETELSNKRKSLSSKIKRMLTKQEGVSSGEADQIIGSPRSHVIEGDKYFLVSLEKEKKTMARHLSGEVEEEYYQHRDFSPDGKNVGVVDRKSAYIRDLDGNIKLEKEGRWKQIYFSPSGRYFALRADIQYQHMLSWDGNDRNLRDTNKRHVEGVYIFDLNGRMVGYLGDEAYVESFAFSPSGTMVATGRGRKVRLWGTNWKVLGAIHLEDAVQDICFSRDGLRIFVVTSDSITSWSMQGKLVKKIDIGKKITSIAMSPDRESIWIWAGEQLMQFSTGDLELCDSFHVSRFLSHGLDFLEDGKTLVMAGRVWRKRPKSDELVRLLLELDGMPKNEPSYEDFVAGNPDRYREMLLVLPPVEGRARFKEHSHWNELDVVAHARISLRGDAMFVDEVQSDWHQGIAGRKHFGDHDEDVIPASEFPGAPGRNEPKVPFSKDWDKLVLKHLISHAAEIGVSKLVLTDAVTIDSALNDTWWDYGEKAKIKNEGLIGFYDKRLVDLFASLVSRLGGKVERLKVKGFRKTFPGVRMTPALRKAICSGFDLWGKT